MSGIVNAWRAASRGQKITIAVALLVALGGISTLMAPAGSVAPGQPTAAVGSPLGGASSAPSALAAAATPTQPLVTATPSKTSVAKVTPRPTARPTPPPTPRPTPKPTAKPTPAPTTAPTGVYGNPWGYNFSPGQLITSPPANFCAYFDCIASFWTSTNGYVVQCADSTFSHSGGRQGVCSRHGGYYQTLYSH
ncbi:MAG TPA: hypothetical protein VNF73_00765 [Candidatus Saccharimonadales bacterium]|nr:hypothetical protein [Candidatus Saccharimonadales bacterium]